MTKLKIGSISNMIVHMVGNRDREEGVSFSQTELDFKDVEKDFVEMIATSFLTEEMHEFFFESSVNLNPIYSFVKTIFGNKTRFVEQSNYIAKILYENSNHPRIKAGELSIVYLKNCEYDGKQMDAIALFKSENKQKGMLYNRTNDGFKVVKQEMISLTKIEKGCLILDIDDSNGYKVAVVDKISKGKETKYWRDDFLHIRPLLSAYHQTKNLISVCKIFIKEESKNISKLEQSFIVARVKSAMADNEILNIEQFANKVFQESTQAEEFLRYAKVSEYRDILQQDYIEVDNQIAKRKSSFPKTILHLDSNFDITVYGGEQLLIRGYDENAGLNFYTCYFSKEK